jgi:hypothetical protein
MKARPQRTTPRRRLTEVLLTFVYCSREIAMYPTRNMMILINSIIASICPCLPRVKEALEG